MLDIKKDIPLRDYTTFHIGGPAEYFVDVHTAEELREAVRWARTQARAVTVLGGGSNVLVADEGIRGLVIHNCITGIDVDEQGDHVALTAGAGEVFDDVVAYVVQHGWWGLENLSCIPGSVGATPVQNIGAYGVEIKDRIVHVGVYDMQTDAIAELAPDACAFAYRDSLFKHEDGARYIITHVTYTLSKLPAPVLHYRDLAAWNKTYEGEVTLAAIRDAVCTIRSRKFPDWTEVGTAGSFFKNPTVSQEHYKKLQEKYPDIPGHPVRHGVKIPLGWVLDNVLKVRGYREGSVGTYEGQALVVVNHGGASAGDVRAFVDLLAQKIFDVTNIRVEWEVTHVQ